MRFQQQLYPQWILLIAVLPNIALVLLVSGFTTTVPLQVQSYHGRTTQSSSTLYLFGGGGVAKIPTSIKDRDSMAISAIKAAIAKPKTTGYGLIECEFPPLGALNKLGDGSFRSMKQVDTANIQFTKSLIQSIAPLAPILGPKVWLLTSDSATSSFVSNLKKQVGNGIALHSLRDGLPDTLSISDVCVMPCPSSRRDYMAAQQLANQCKAVVVVNGFAKDTKSIPDRATMAYYLKPLTYNSQVVGYLTRSYPGVWSTIEVFSKQILGSFDDSQILVRGTNTPDLRDSGRLVQKFVDERAIQARKGQRQRQ